DCRHLIGLLTLGPAGARFDEAPKVRAEGNEPFAHFLERRSADASPPEIEAKACCRALVRSDALRLWELRHVLEYPSRQSLADIRPGLLEPKCFVHVADEHFDVVATFLPCGLD